MEDSCCSDKEERARYHYHYHYQCGKEEHPPSPNPDDDEDDDEPTMNPVCLETSVFYDPTSTACTCDPLNLTFYDSEDPRCFLPVQCHRALPGPEQDLTDPLWLPTVFPCICIEAFPGSDGSGDPDVVDLIEDLCVNSPF